MTRTCYTSEQVVFDEPTMNSTVADIEIEEVLIKLISRVTNNIDMLDMFCSEDSCAMPDSCHTEFYMP